MDFFKLNSHMWTSEYVLFLCVPMTLLVVPPGQPTVERQGPLFPALETNTTLCFWTASVITSQILLRDSKQIDKISKSTKTQNEPTQPFPPLTAAVQNLPRIGPVCSFPIAIVNQVTLVVDYFNHLKVTDKGIIKWMKTKRQLQLIFIWLQA